MDYDAYPIKVFTAYTAEELRAAQKVMFRYVRLATQVAAVTLAGIGAISFFRSLWESQQISNAVFDSLSIFVWAIIFLIVSVILSGRWYSKRQMKEDENLKYVRNGVQFFFRGQGLEAFFGIDERSKCIQKGYTDIAKVLETKDAFYIYFGIIQYILISKNGFSSGTPKELATLLRKVVPSEKYKILN